MKDDTDPRLKFLQALEQTTRALTGNTKLKISFGDAENESADEMVLPNIPEKPSAGDLVLARGLADRMAFVRRYADLPQLWKGLGLPKSHARHIVRQLESVRVEEQGAHDYPGASHNIHRLNTAEAQLMKLSGNEPPLEYALALTFRKAMGMPLSDSQAELLARAEATLDTDILLWAQRAPARLRTPEERAKTYQDLLTLLDLQEPETEADSDTDEGTPQESRQDSGQSESSDDKDNQSQTEAGDADSSEQSGEDDTAAEDDMDGHFGEQGGRRSYQDEDSLYHAYTTEYDRIVNALELVTTGELHNLRERYRAVTEGNRQLVSRLAARLQRFLLARTRRGWLLDQEEGLLDPHKLSQVIASAEPLAFMLPHETPRQNTVVSLLVDNSGSMRGRPIEMAAVSTDILSRTLERCGVKVEVLGFTTQTWKGGNARLQWITDGGPENPGRLNDLLHIIYKSADAPYRKSRGNFAVMMNDEVLKENIDGESLQWAYQRLVRRAEQRKIMLVISDGAPVDYATDKHNSVNYLDAHLRRVIGRIEKAGEVELIAIGIGHDVGRYYKNAITINDPSQLANVLLEQLSGLFMPGHKRKSFIGNKGVGHLA